MRRILDHRLHSNELVRISEENRLRNRWLRELRTPPSSPRRQPRIQRMNLLEILQDTLSEWMNSDEMAAT
jgi:hypothetical protein